jgi:hypothetical protein
MFFCTGIPIMKWAKADSENHQRRGCPAAGIKENVDLLAGPALAVLRH